MPASENRFFSAPILNSPYEYPSRHWELDADGQPTQQIIETRRKASFISPIPKAKKRKVSQSQQGLAFQDEKGLSDAKQQYETNTTINEIRNHVDRWRTIPSPNDWGVTPETARLLQHWRSFDFQGVRPFFCQIEAVEVAIWLTEVAPQDATGKKFLAKLESINAEANAGLNRLALKLATGAGKTTVMAMLIAWQTVNAARYPASKRFTRGFLIVTPGLTIKDRLRVLLPNDPENYYRHRDLVPIDLLPEIMRATVVITNYHAFKLKERLEISKGGKALLKGRGGAEIDTRQTEGQMLQEVMAPLMGIKNILVLNDEAHHCYREKPKPEGQEPDDDDEEDLKGDDREEVERNKEAARLWISGLEIVNRKLGINRIFDLSATPFFLRGSGYGEGTLFHWTMSDFSLMDAIECGIVKLPRVPVADNIPGHEMPIFRNLWDHIGRDMPKKGRGKSGELDPLKIPPKLQTALEALYGHYAKTYEEWQKAGIEVPPCFIVVCNNTATSKLVYDFISGFDQINDDGSKTPIGGRLALFRNQDENGHEFARPRTLLIDSHQLESGEALDEKFRKAAGPEIEKFRREIIERGESANLNASDITDQALLREVMNTVGKKGRLGESVRCVVSVSMLTEGWDANTVTHVLGVRAFGTQLLCEQVIGRALRRQSYELNEERKFDVEYADVLGIPFDFTAKPVVSPPQRPKSLTQVFAVKPDRNHLEIRFPRIAGYRVDLPEDRLTATFTDDSVLELTPELIGPSRTQNAGIIGEAVMLSLEHTKDMRTSSILFYLTHHMINKYYRDGEGNPKLHLFGQLKRICKQWLDSSLRCKGDTYPAQLLYKDIAERACQLIYNGITDTLVDKGQRIQVQADPYNPEGSTFHVNFNTAKTTLWKTAPERSHVNWVVCDSDWEAEFCRAVEAHPRVKSYVKNHSLGFEVPYVMGPDTHRYRPDFIVRLDDGHGESDLLNLVVEIKGYRGEDAKVKAATMKTFWVPGVNNDGRWGRWAFAEFTEVYAIQSDLEAKVAQEVEKTLAQFVQTAPGRKIGVPA